MAQKNTKSVSLKLETHELAKKTAEEYGITMLEFFERATERLNKKLFFIRLHNDYEKLIKVNNAWKEEIKRREFIGIDLPKEDSP